jgi:hypothetical protein
MAPRKYVCHFMSFYVIIMSVYVIVNLPADRLLKQGLSFSRHWKMGVVNATTTIRSGNRRRPRPSSSKDMARLSVAVPAGSHLGFGGVATQVRACDTSSEGSLRNEVCDLGRPLAARTSRRTLTLSPHRSLGTLWSKFWFPKGPTQDQALRGCPKPAEEISE